MKKIILTALSLCLLISICYSGTVTTSSITASTIITQVRYDLNETTEGYWKDTELLKWTDEAVRAIVSRTRCLESTSSGVTAIENTRSYSISGSFLDVEKVEYDIGLSGNTTEKTQIYDLDRVPFGKLRYKKEKEVGDPKTFSVWNNSLYVWPIPGSDQSGNTFYVYTIPLPSGVTLTTSPIETPAYFDTAILYYVKGKAMMKQNQEGRASTYFQMFESLCTRYRQDIMRRELIQGEPAQ